MRDEVQQGNDPITIKRIETQSQCNEIPLFGDFADEFIAIQAASFRNSKHIAQWKMTLTVYAAPYTKETSQ